MINEGTYTNLSSEDYHNDKQSISRSALMDFKKSPRKYWAKHLNPDRPPAETKPSWEFGTAFHTLILEPHLFSEHYFIMPKKYLKRDNEELFNVHKEAEKNAETTDRIILSFKDYEALLNMQSELYHNGRAKELIEGAVYESSYFWKDKSGLMLKSRPDILHSNMYVDLKTIDDASPHNYQRKMVEGGFHIQAAMVKDAVLQLTGKNLLGFINICVEKTYPYSIGIYVIDDEAIEAGRVEYKQLCVDLQRAIHDNVFNDYEICTIGLPSWY